ncbi:hypothetical protein [Piscinibacter sakaiensis]|uniref:hypothetical protein n=1 Tax=Piscinibacter sakaiensis TaxID=1547922 RepID=UPI003AAFBAA0
MQTEESRENAGSTPPKPRGHWEAIRAHPLIIVLTLCAATATATAGLFMKIIIPHEIKILEVQLADAKRQVELLPITKRTVQERNREIAKLQDEVIALKLRNTELSKVDAFSSEDPYPRGFRRARIGSSFSDLYEIFPGRVAKDDPDDTYASVTTDDHFFSSVTYYYSEKSGSRRIDHILFHIRHDQFERVESSKGEQKVQVLTSPEVIKRLFDRRLNAAALKTQLERSFGPANKTSKRVTSWKVKGLLITLSDGTIHIERL